MNKKINSDIKSLQLIFEKNKPFIIPFIVIIICVILIIKIEFPLLKNFNKVKGESQKASYELSSLKKDLSIISGLDESSLSLDLAVLHKALPANKDFAGILNAIYFAAQKTGISFGEFSFQVGDLNKLDGGDKFPSIKLSLTANNDIRSVNSFIDAISKTLPLSDISVVKASNKTTRVDVLFYYKNLVLSLPKDDLRIKPLSSERLSLIEEIKKFNKTSSDKNSF